MPFYLDLKNPDADDDAFVYGALCGATTISDHIIKTVIRL
jgi:hypothetical protein